MTISASIALVRRRGAPVGQLRRRPDQLALDDEQQRHRAADRARTAQARYSTSIARRSGDAGARSCGSGSRKSFAAILEDIRRNSLSVVPAKAGTHRAVARAAEKWLPAFAGTTI